MARRAALGGAGLNPFGGTGVDFGAFDITGSNRESTLILTRVEVAWAAGQATNAEYLAALSAYAGTLTANTSERLNAEARVETVKYRVEREILASEVDAGIKTLPDLLAYDQSKLAGLKTDSEEYLQRQNVYQATQSRYYSELERPIVQSYNDGQMTTAQLNAWYLARQLDPNFAGNTDIAKNVDTRIHELATRTVQERDTLAMDAYNKGTMAPVSFIAYAVNARSRYVQGSTDYQDWSTRIEDANSKSVETSLLYRYDLSQKYAQLAKFVADSKAPAGSSGGTSTSSSTRVVLGADGVWHSVTTKSTKSTAARGPSTAAQAAYHQRQVEVADAKVQMREIAAKVAGVGGFTTTDSMIGYYQGQQSKFAKSSAEWYGVQGKLDSLNDRKHQELVDARLGARISYPSSGGGGGGGAATASKAPYSASKAAGAAPTVAVKAPVKSDTAGIGIDAFMAAIGHVESAGSYTATNKSSGSFGKYQIPPANWPGWAQQYLGRADAPSTPENQEIVAKAKMTELYKQTGDWRAVAQWWLTHGSIDSAVSPSGWATTTTKYVDNVMSILGRGPTSGSSLVANDKGPVSGIKPAGSGTGYLQVVVGEGRPGEGGAPTTTRTNLPANLDSATFTHFYAAYSAAFQSGSTEFSIDTGKGLVHYFIGDDNVERRDGMRSMDELRVQLYGFERKAYQGTPSEETAAGHFNGAVEDAAKHEMMILDTFEKYGVPTGAPEQNASPIASGIDMLRNTVSAIDVNLKAADAALKRGDLTTAYSLYQMAASLRASKDQMIARFTAAGQNAVAAIEAGYGIGREQALGVDAAKKLTTDLEELGGFGATLEKALGAGAPTLTLLNSIIKRDSNGNPVRDAGTYDGQLMLANNWHFEIQGDGSVKPVLTDLGGYDNNRQMTPVMKGMVHTTYVTGNSTVEAYVKYESGQVGYVLDKDGTKVPIMGKTIQRPKADGSGVELWVEDPFHPGKWSSSAIVYNAPAGFKAILGKNGSVALQFDGMDPGQSAFTPGQLATHPNGWTYRLEFDSVSGTYQAFRSHGQDWFKSPIVDEPLGALSDGSPVANAFGLAGFARDLSGLTGDQLTMASLGDPFLGGSAQQYRDWKNSFQSPFQPTSKAVDPMSAWLAGAPKQPAQQPTMDPMAPWLARSADAYTPTGRAADDVALARSPLGGKAVDDLVMGGLTAPVLRRLDTSIMDPTAAWLAKPTGAPPALKPLPTRSMQPTIDQPLPPSRQAATAAAAKTAAAQATADALAASRAATTKRTADAEARRRAAAAVALSSSVAPLAPAYTGSGPRRQTPL